MKYFIALLGAIMVKFTTLAKDWWFNQNYVSAMRRPYIYQPLLAR